MKRKFKRRGRVCPERDLASRREFEIDNLKMKIEYYEICIAVLKSKIHRIRKGESF